MCCVVLSLQPFELHAKSFLMTEQEFRQRVDDMERELTAQQDQTAQSKLAFERQQSQHTELISRTADRHAAQIQELESRITACYVLIYLLL